MHPESLCFQLSVVLVQPHTSVEFHRKLLFVSLFLSTERKRGSAGVLPFGKPEWHVSTTEPDKETSENGEGDVRGGGEEGREGREGRRGGRGGMRNLNEWTKMGWLESSTVKRKIDFGFFFPPSINQMISIPHFRSVIAGGTSLAWLPLVESFKYNKTINIRFF